MKKKTISMQTEIDQDQEEVESADEQKMEDRGERYEISRRNLMKTGATATAGAVAVGAGSSATNVVQPAQAFGPLTTVVAVNVAAYQAVDSFVLGRNVEKAKKRSKEQAKKEYREDVISFAREGAKDINQVKNGINGVLSQVEQTNNMFFQRARNILAEEYLLGSSEDEAVDKILSELNQITSEYLTRITEERDYLALLVGSIISSIGVGPLSSTASYGFKDRADEYAEVKSIGSLSLPNGSTISYEAIQHNFEYKGSGDNIDRYIASPPYNNPDGESVDKSHHEGKIFINKPDGSQQLIFDTEIFKNAYNTIMDVHNQLKTDVENEVRNIYQGMEDGKIDPEDISNRYGGLVDEKSAKDTEAVLSSWRLSGFSESKNKVDIQYGVGKYRGFLARDISSDPIDPGSVNPDELFGNIYFVGAKTGYVDGVTEETYDVDIGIGESGTGSMDIRIDDGDKISINADTITVTLESGIHSIELIDQETGQTEAEGHILVGSRQSENASDEFLFTPSEDYPLLTGLKDDERQSRTWKDEPDKIRVKFNEKFSIISETVEFKKKANVEVDYVDLDRQDFKDMKDQVKAADKEIAELEKEIKNLEEEIQNVDEGININIPGIGGIGGFFSNITQLVTYGFYGGLAYIAYSIFSDDGGVDLNLNDD